MLSGPLGVGVAAGRRISPRPAEDNEEVQPREWVRVRMTHDRAVKPTAQQVGERECLVDLEKVAWPKRSEGAVKWGCMWVGANRPGRTAQKGERRSA
jgi:hypothetical protein